MLSDYNNFFEDDMRAVIRLFSIQEKELIKSYATSKELTFLEKIKYFFNDKDKNINLCISTKRDISTVFSNSIKYYIVEKPEGSFYIYLHPYSFYRKKTMTIELYNMTNDFEFGKDVKFISCENNIITIDIELGKDTELFKFTYNCPKVLKFGIKKIRGIPNITHIYGLQEEICPLENNKDNIPTKHNNKIKIKKGNIVYTAFLASMSSNRDAIDFLQLFSDNENAQSVLNLFYANEYLDDHAKWLYYVNQYLAKYNISPIKLHNNGYLKFENLYCDVEVGKHNGSLITVIMPAFNAASTIEMAASSILKQSWKNLELIIVDDASSDHTWEKMQKISEQDARVRILRNSINVGPYVSKNIALRIARGEFITGHDADDWSHPDRIFNQVSLFSNKDISAAIGYMVRMEPTGKFSTFGKLGNFCIDGAARKASISCMFRTKILRDTLGYWDSVRFGADSEMIDRAQRVLGQAFLDIPQMTMLCQDAPGSLTNSAEFGVKKLGGISPTRKEYKAAWLIWHKGLTEGAVCPMTFPPQRSYIVPEAIDVPEEDINTLIKQYTEEGVF